MAINMAIGIHFIALLKMKRFLYFGDHFGSIDHNGASRVSKFTETTYQQYYFMLLFIRLMVWNLWGHLYMLRYFLCILYMYSTYFLLFSIQSVNLLFFHILQCRCVLRTCGTWKIANNYDNFELLRCVW